MACSAVSQVNGLAAFHERTSASSGNLGIMHGCIAGRRTCGTIGGLLTARDEQEARQKYD
jgi:hypothetical protein